MFVCLLVLFCFCFVLFCFVFSFCFLLFHFLSSYLICYVFWRMFLDFYRMFWTFYYWLTYLSSFFFQFDLFSFSCCHFGIVFFLLLPLFLQFIFLVCFSLWSIYKHIYVLHLYFHLHFESLSTLVFFFQSNFKILVSQVFAYRPTLWYPRLISLVIIKDNFWNENNHNWSQMEPIYIAWPKLHWIRSPGGGGLLSPKSYVDVPARPRKSDVLYTNFLPNFPPISIPFSKEKHPIWIKLGAFYNNLPKIHPIYVIWAPSSLMKTHRSLYQISRKSAPKGRHIYVYHVNVRTPPPRRYVMV